MSDFLMTLAEITLTMSAVILLLLLLSFLNRHIPAEAHMTLFEPEQLAPGVSVFSLSFLALFSALPEFLPLWGVLAASTLACAAVSVLAALVTSLVSSKTRSSIASVLICTVLFEGLCLLV